jgi:hypothetical protein
MTKQADLESAKEHYHFELARKSEINANLRNNIQLAIAGMGFLFIIGKENPICNPLIAYAFWISFCLLSVSIISSAFAAIYFPTRFPDDPKKIERYYQELKQYDAESADINLQKYLIERWIDNASTNASRNRQRSKLNFYSRIALSLSGLPLLLILMSSSKIPFPL